jgi:hypothetical protein
VFVNVWFTALSRQIRPVLARAEDVCQGRAAVGWRLATGLAVAEASSMGLRRPSLHSSGVLFERAFCCLFFFISETLLFRLLSKMRAVRRSRNLSRQLLAVNAASRVRQSSTAAASSTPLTSVLIANRGEIAL